MGGARKVRIINSPYHVHIFGIVEQRSCGCAEAVFYVQWKRTPEQGDGVNEILYSHAPPQRFNGSVISSLDSLLGPSGFKTVQHGRTSRPSVEGFREKKTDSFRITVNDLKDQALYCSF